MDVKEIVMQYLTENGYDGLFSDECGCKTYRLMPCGSDFALSCMPGYVWPCDCGTGLGETEHDFHIMPSKRQTPRTKTLNAKNVYHVLRNRCDCHPDTCSCNDWAVHAPNGEKHSTYLHRETAHEVSEALNMKRSNTELTGAPHQGAESNHDGR